MSSPMRFLVALILIGCLAPLALQGQEKSVRPGINRQYFEADLASELKRLEGEKREIFQHRQAIVAACQVHSGMDIGDIGAGTGLFTRLLAPLAAPGKIYAVDIAPKFIDHIRDTCREEHLENVVPVLSTDTSPRLADASIDLALVCDVYHHFEYPYSMLAALHRALRPKGTLLVVDFEREEGVSEKWILEHVRAGKKTVIAEISRAGFQLMEQPQLMKGQYVLRFARCDRPAGDVPEDKPHPSHP